MNTWTPAVGLLVTRVEVRNESSDFLICYRDRPDDTSYYQCICRIYNFRAEAFVFGMFEPITEDAVVWGCGDVTVHRHFSTWEELCVLRRLWSGALSYEQWLQRVQEFPRLAGCQKYRLERAGAEQGVR
jgi:hypothetical protein